MIGHRRERPRPACPAGVGGLLVALLLVAACAPGAAPSGGAAAPAARPVGSAPAADSGAAAAPTAPPAPIRLFVNWAAVGAGQSGIWMTYEGGYFQEHGLDVELTNVPATARAIQAMMQGEVHLSMVEPATAIQISLSGADTVLLFGAINRLVYSVMAQPGLTEPQALRGRVLGITRIGSATHSAARVALAGWGLVPDQDVALRQLGDNAGVVAALDAGQIDAAMLSAPNNVRARRAGFVELLDLASVGPEYVSLAVGGLRTWVAANEEAVRRFARAYAQGIHSFKTDRAWAQTVHRKYLRTDDQQLLDDAYDLYRDYFPSVPYVSEAGIARLLEDLVLEDPRLVGRTAAEWVDGRYVRELETSGFMQRLGGP